MSSTDFKDRVFNKPIMKNPEYKYMVNQFGVAFELNENLTLPANTEGYNAPQKKELLERLGKEWDVSPEDAESHMYFIDVKNKTITGDRGITTELDKPVLKFIEQYEV